MITPSTRDDTEGPLLAGIDVGTGHIRTLIFDAGGRKVSAASVATPLHRPAPDRAEHRPAEVWSAVATTLRDAVAGAPAGRPIAGVAVASFGEAAVPLDANLEPVGDIIAWYDPRSEPQARTIAATIGVERLFAVTGLALNPTFGLCKLLWLRDNAPENASRIRHWLNVADWIAFRLSGVMATDYTLASRTLALDLGARRWSTELLADLDLAPEIFPEIRGFGSALGHVQQSAADETGLPTSAIVGVGGHDHVCGALAEGLVRPGRLLDSMGTSEGLFVATSSRQVDETLRVRGVSQGALTEAHNYIVGSLNTSGGAIEWFRGLLAPGVSHAELISAASVVPAGSHGVLFLPHLRYGSPGTGAEAARGAFLGLAAGSDRGVLFRALLEGLAYEARSVADVLRSLADTETQGEILVTGGGTRNDLLMAIKAAAFGQPLAVSDRDESTSLGAALLGGVASGTYAGIGDAIDTTRAEARIVTPDARWQRLYADIYEHAYRRIEPSLQPLHDVLRTLI